MKKVIVLLAALLVLAPISASALEMMSDSSMKDVTGQAGVSIAIDDVVIYQSSISDVTYRDTDGLTAVNPAYLGGTSTESTISNGLGDAGITIDYSDNITKLITIDAIEDGSVYGVAAINSIFSGNAEYTPDTAGILDIPGSGVLNTLIGLGYDPLNGNLPDDFRSGLSPLTIDVGSCTTLSDGLEFNTAGGVTQDVAGVIIGLPTVEITTYSNNSTRNIRVTTNDTAGAINEGKSFIQIEESGYSRMAILGGIVEIAPH